MSPSLLAKSSRTVTVLCAGTTILYQSGSTLFTMRLRRTPLRTKRALAQELFGSELSSGPAFRKFLIRA